MLQSVHQWRQYIWQPLLPVCYSIPTRFITLSSQEIQFLLSDNTTMKIDQLPCTNCIKANIHELGGQVFVKVSQRTAKDMSQLARNCRSVQDISQLIKMSEYLTEGIDQEYKSNKNGIILTLRQYSTQLATLHHQFRVYIKKNLVVGICQKNTCIIGLPITNDQISAIVKANSDIIQSLGLQYKENQLIFQCYCNPNGNLKILEIDVYHLHPLCLFKQEQLQKQLQMNQKQKPLTKMITNAEDIKEIDMSDYKVGSQLVTAEIISEWKQFIGLHKDNNTIDINNLF